MVISYLIYPTALEVHRTTDSYGAMFMIMPPHHTDIKAHYLKMLHVKHFAKFKQILPICTRLTTIKHIKTAT